MKPTVAQILFTIAGIGIGGLTYCGLMEKMSVWPFVFCGAILVSVIGIQKLTARKK